MNYHIADMGGIGSNALERAAMQAGFLPPLCPTDPEVDMALHFPNDSELMHQWLGTAGGRIVLNQLAETDEHYGDPSWRQVSVVMPGDVVSKRAVYRAEHSTRGGRALMSALGWLAGSQLPPRGHMAGRILPEA